MKKPENCALYSLKSTLLSVIHGVSVPCDWASRYVCFIGWKNPKSAPFFSLKSILLSMIHGVSVSCTWVSRYMYFIGWKKPEKCVLLLLKSILLKLCLELLNFPIYLMDFLYINCTNYLQCLSYPISLLLALWLTPLILAALFVLMAPSRIHQRLTGIMTRMTRSPWRLCHHLHLSTWFKLLLPHQRGSILFLHGKQQQLLLLPAHIILAEPCTHLRTLPTQTMLWMVPVHPPICGLRIVWPRSVRLHLQLRLAVLFVGLLIQKMRVKHQLLMVREVILRLSSLMQRPLL